MSSSSSHTSVVEESSVRPVLRRQVSYNVVDGIKIPVPAGEPDVIVDNNESILGLSAVAILRWMYGTIFAYSILVSLIVGCSWYSMLLYYIAGLLCFYLWHWQAHHRLTWVPFNKGCYIKHKEHHWEIFPPDRFFGVSTNTEHNPHPKTWIQYVKHKTWISDHEALLYILMLGVLFLSKIYLSVSWGTFSGGLIGYLLMGFIGNYLHHSFHVYNHWLSCYKWFHELRALHYVHHLGTAKHNYAVLNMSLDRFMGSFLFNTPHKKS